VACGHCCGHQSCLDCLCLCGQSLQLNLSIQYSKVQASGHFDDCRDCTESFHTVGDAMLTLVKTILAGDSWGQIAVPTMQVAPWTSVFFLSSLVSVQLGMLNLVLAVIVQRAQEAHSEDINLVLSERLSRFHAESAHLLEICQKIDRDKSGALTPQEFIEGMDRIPEFADILRFLNLSRADMSIMFELLDQDSSGTISYKEFVEKMFSLKYQDSKTLLLYNVGQLRKLIQSEVSLMKSALIKHMEELDTSNTESMRALLSEINLAIKDRSDKEPFRQQSELVSQQVPTNLSFETDRNSWTNHVPCDNADQGPSLRVLPCPVQPRLPDELGTDELIQKLKTVECEVQEEVRALQHKVNECISNSLQSMKMSFTAKHDPKHRGVAGRIESKSS